MKTNRIIKTKPSTAAKPAGKSSPPESLRTAPDRKRGVKLAPVAAPVAPTLAPPARGRREITTDLIAQRAYIIWEQQGRPSGNDLANWLLAESQLKEEIQSFTA